MNKGWCPLLLLVIVFTTCGRHTVPGPADRIPGVALNQQRIVQRGELGFAWPLTVGTGTLGCASGAVTFKSGGTIYALNDVAKSRGLAAIQPLWKTQSAPASHPLGRIRQEQRMAIFAEAMRCDRGSDPQQAPDKACAEQVRTAHQLSKDDLDLIEAEGRERAWPPLPPVHMDLDPLIEAGLKLCRE